MNEKSAKISIKIPGTKNDAGIINKINNAIISPKNINTYPDITIDFNTNINSLNYKQLIIRHKKNIFTSLVDDDFYKNNLIIMLEQLANVLNTEKKVSYHICQLVHQNPESNSDPAVLE